jgi:mono/diheme cytochrome c family protein
MDGELYYTIVKGRRKMCRRKMPGEEGHIKPEQIWHMVNYIRPAQNGPQRKPKEERPQPNTGLRTLQ